MYLVKMDKPVYVLSEHEVFIREFIALYKQHPVLWQQKHPQHRNRAERAEAYEVLVKKCRQYFPEADEDFVRMKIDSMRSTFRKERRKVLSSKENSKNPEDVYKPSLWYYELLLFTAGEEVENETTANNTIEKEEIIVSSNNLEDGNVVKIPFWNREHSAMLINFYKNYPCLYSTSHPHYRNKRKRNDAVKKITEKLMTVTGKYFHTEDVRKKISLIRGQFLYEYKKIKKSEKCGEVYKPSLWCFEILNFLTEEYSKGKNYNKSKELHMNLRQKNRRKKSVSEDSEEDMDIKKESDSSLSGESIHLEFKESMPGDDDIFDTIAKNVAHKLRNMTEEQRNIAEKIVKDVMYHGQMENLSTKSRLSLDGS